jgi:hypothetical protein
MMDDKEMKRVIEICNRLEPIIQRFITSMIDRDDANVTTSVVSNLATSFMAQAITMIEARGADVDQFVTILMYETKQKYTQAKAQIESELALSKMMSAGRDSAGPLH